MTEQSIGAMIKNGKNELINGKYIQSEIEISQQTGFIESNNNMMFQILDNLNKAK